MRFHEGKLENRGAATVLGTRKPARAFEAWLSWAGVMIILDSSIAAKLFTGYPHPLFPLAASGLRVETAQMSDKQKSEVYFPKPPKKFLTVSLNQKVTI